MLTDDGPRLLEFNARLGDPGDAGDPAAPRRRRSGRCCSPRPAARSPDDGAPLPVLPGATVGIVLAAAGYPGASRPRAIGSTGSRRRRRPARLVFHAATRRDRRRLRRRPAAGS